MLHRAKSLSSSFQLLKEECDRLLLLFHRLKYPDALVKSIVSKFMNENFTVHDADPQSNISQQTTTGDRDAITIVLPFKDQKSANVVKHQLFHLSNKIGKQLNPVFTSRKIKSELKVCERKPALLSKQCVVYICLSVTSATLVVLAIDGLHLTSWRPCWRYNTKEYVINSIVGSSRCGWLTLSATSREIDCKPRTQLDTYINCRRKALQGDTSTKSE